MVYPYNKILLNYKEKWTFDTHYNMDKSQENHAEWKKPDFKMCTYWIIPCI